jgi:phytoene synthase
MLPKEKRWATYALYGFCRYADNIIDNPRGRSVEDLLDEVEYIKRELKRAYKNGESEHPTLKSFIIIAKEYNIPMEYPMDLMEGVMMDLQMNRYETFDDLYLFAYRVAGVVGLMMTHILGYKSEAAFEYAEKLGIAMQLTNILRDVKEDKNMNRIYLPKEDLRSFNIKEEDLFKENMNENMHRMMQFQVDRAHRYYEEADMGIPMLNQKSQFAIYSASRIYRGILMKIEARNYNPFLGRVWVTQTRKFGILLAEIMKTRVLRPAFTIFT